ncbi:cyanophycinase [bacterium]|nr:cyanophycinase [bacterium]
MRPAVAIACALCLVSAAHPMQAAEAPRRAFAGGPFVLMSDGADQEAIGRRILQLAGGDRARLVIVPAASEAPGTVGKTYQTYFKRLGARDVQVVIPTGEPSAAQAATFHQATGFFLPGGDPRKILKTLSKPSWQGALQGAWRRGAVIAGMGSGAMVWGDLAILGNEKATFHPMLGAGFGLLESAVVDAHFTDRGGFGRLVEATVHRSPVLGIGLEPKTALVVTPDGRAEVSGQGTVTLVRPMGRPAATKPLSIADVRVRILAPGEQAELLGEAVFGI